MALQANIFGVGGGVLSFDFGRAKMKYKHHPRNPFNFLVYMEGPLH